MYAIRTFEKGLWTVGHYHPADGTFYTIADYHSREEAMKAIHFMNGGGSKELTQLKDHLEYTNELLHIMVDWLKSRK